MALKEKINIIIDSLDEAELRQVDEYLSF